MDFISFALFNYFFFQIYSSILIKWIKSTKLNFHYNKKKPLACLLGIFGDYIYFVVKKFSPFFFLLEISFLLFFLSFIKKKLKKPKTK